jgi:DNA repair exonuclease SbcCD ATPase subunit
LAAMFEKGYLTKGPGDPKAPHGEKFIYHNPPETGEKKTAWFGKELFRRTIEKHPIKQKEPQTSDLSFDAQTGLSEAKRSEADNQKLDKEMEKAWHDIDSEIKSLESEIRYARLDKARRNLYQAAIREFGKLSDNLESGSEEYDWAERRVRKMDPDLADFLPDSVKKMFGVRERPFHGIDPEWGRSSYDESFDALAGLTESARLRPTEVKMAELEKEMARLRQVYDEIKADVAKGDESAKIALASVEAEIIQIEPKVAEAVKAAKRAKGQRASSRARYGAMRDLGMKKTPYGWE